jgi:hypothetical protein
MTLFRRRIAILVALALLALAGLGVIAVSAQQAGSISGRVYCDANYNYSYDAGEEIAGVMLTLYDDAECDYVADLPARASQDSAGDGTYGFTTLPVGGATWAERVCYVLEVDETAPELGNCNYIDWNPRNPYLYSGLVDWTGEDFRFQQLWDKTVDGQPWLPGMTVTAETSDTITVIDTIFVPQGDTAQQQEPSYVLVESWNPAELALVDVEWDAFTTVISQNGTLTWTVPWFQTPVPTATLTKMFHVEPCTWTATTLEETVYESTEGPPFLIEARPVVVDKTQPDLWIDSTYSAEVSPGQAAAFALSYGNNGGFENLAWIRNEFPPEAPFDSSTPVPDRQAADGSWVEWDLGSLSNGDGGNIDVTVAIQDGLLPSTTLVITDWIYNHAEQAVDYTEIRFHIEQPPLSLGDRVWYDTDQNGIQDAGEPGVQGIGVDLYPRVCSGSVLASDTTDASGNYLFADLSPGIYCLQFSNVPAGWTITAQNQGADDTADSDADPATAQITDIDLQADDLDEDMGLYTEGSIGDTVFCDANDNGAFDAGEGLAAVAVSLYDDPGCDGAAVNLLATQDTVGDGQYLFSGLQVGPPGGPPICYVAAVDETDADLDDCNVPLGPISYSVQLEANNADYLDADFGFTSQDEPLPTPTPGPETPPVVPEASTLVLLGGALSGLAGYAGLQIRARRKKSE